VCCMWLAVSPSPVSLCPPGAGARLSLRFRSLFVVGWCVQRGLPVLALFPTSHRIAMSVGELDTAAVPSTSVHNISDLSPDEHWQLYQYYVGAFGGLIILLGLIRSVRTNTARSHTRGRYTC
jgi:hypothetical protein